MTRRRRARGRLQLRRTARAGIPPLPRVADHPPLTRAGPRRPTPGRLIVRTRVPGACRGGAPKRSEEGTRLHERHVHAHSGRHSLVSANSVETLASPNACGRLRTRGARCCGSSEARTRLAATLARARPRESRRSGSRYWRKRGVAPVAATHVQRGDSGTQRRRCRVARVRSCASVASPLLEQRTRS